MLLLFILMHSKKPLFFQSLREHCIWHSRVLLWVTASTATAVLPALHLHPKCISLPRFLLPLALYLMLIKLSTLSFPPLQPVCVGGEMAESLAHSLFPESFTEPSANLSDYFILQSCHRPLSLLETGVNPGSGEAWKSVGGKCQGSVFATQFISGPRVRAVPEKEGHGCDEETSGCVIPVWVKGLHLGRTEPPDSNLKWEEALLSRQGMCVREVTQSQSGCGLEHECVNRADERLQQMWPEQHHLVSRKKWGT